MARSRTVMQHPPFKLKLFLVLLLVIGTALSRAAVPEEKPAQVVSEFLLLLVGSPSGRSEALVYVQDHWQPAFTPMALEVLTLIRDPEFASRLIQVMEKETGQSFGYRIDQWQLWLWAQEPVASPFYAEFKSALYGLIDGHFEDYFGLNRTALIRLDEVVWGGVVRDGIPPLRQPEMIAAGDASYLNDDHLVFGLAVNGDVRAYPQRILGWHEMFVDEVGGVPVAGVYCTLCGTMILYKTELEGMNHALGTSGFLYRSNKLMYDQATQSLWNTMWGKPVIGPLAGQDIALQRMSVVTTTWGEWRARHPGTKVLSMGTGYNRDYSEGAAYRKYFATDELMFQVPTLDSRLKNKDEILGLVFPQSPDKPLAISTDFLSANPVYQDRIGDLALVVLTDSSGANRVYQADDVIFSQFDGRYTVRDDRGVEWLLDEAQLQASDGRVLYRLPAHRAFWFGWFSAYSHTRLVN
jgi:hypothetical protein